MKAITIKQPWASLIVYGIKDIENRTWPCPRKYIGQRVFIHAADSHGRMFSIDLTDAQMKAGFTTIAKETMFGNISFDSIISSVEIADCIGQKEEYITRYWQSSHPSSHFL